MMLLAVSLVASASPALAQATVSISSATVAVDGATTLPIMINDVDDPDGVGTADIKLSFDSDVVRVTASTAGDFDSITPNLEHNESGADSYVTFMAYQSSVNGLTSGTIVTTVTLKAVGTAGQESPLDIAITILSDNTPAGNDISADAVDGTFTVGGGAQTLTWVDYPEGAITQGDDVNLDVMFSEEVDYYIRIENSANGVVWRYPASGTETATDPDAVTWTTTEDTPIGAYTVIVNINGVDDATIRAFTITESGATPTLASITISSASYSLIAGNTQIFTATCTDTTGAEMTCPTLTWSSSNEAIGTITAGVFSALAEGTTTITASADGVTSNAALVTVSPAIVQINSWTLPATGTVGTAIDATVTIENIGTGRWFVVSVAGTSAAGKSIVGLGTIELDAGETKVVNVKIPVPGDAGAAGTYTLYPDVYTFDGYPDVDAIQATGSGETIVIS